MPHSPSSTDYTSRRSLSLGKIAAPLVVALTAAAPLIARASDTGIQVDPNLHRRAANVIRQVFDKEQQWVKVHAAEYLLSLGYPEGVNEGFGKELDLHGGEPQYRIGIWRVLARAANTEEERDEWIGKIHDVFKDPSSPDRLCAAETLAHTICCAG